MSNNIKTTLRSLGETAEGKPIQVLDAVTIELSVAEAVAFYKAVGLTKGKIGEEVFNELGDILWPSLLEDESDRWLKVYGDDVSGDASDNKIQELADEIKTINRA